MTTAPEFTLEHAWLTEAVLLATRNVADGGGPFGALIARGDRIVATGVNRVTPTLDPTAHAEVVAIRAACQELGTFKLDGCVLVSSCEPCPMCLSSALWARVDRVIYAADRDDAAKAGFDDRAFYELFERPRDTWDLPVSRLSATDGFTPFQAWLDQPDRIEY
ncbi:nucleoside deaminase [Amycolatopsis suaedae]|uniref:Nucleoside deaminase n=1 Tax=Amycolatopsis suaedae TaxID=2510978 RepID=A0A4Q7JCC2_9PSEU|nr:nucleoside deaminase [Amycolatopsis suaedae]RZQ63954.1 nucleoside deaminase [Amycolatopsis suaedae]